MIEIKADKIGSNDPKYAEGFLSSDDLLGGIEYTNTGAAFAARDQAREDARQLAEAHGLGHHIVADIQYQTRPSRKDASRRVPIRGRVVCIPQEVWGFALQRKREEARMRRTHHYVPIGDLTNTKNG